MSTEFWQLVIWLIFLGICVFLYRSGLLTDVHVMLGRPPIQKQLTIAYIFGTGPYKNAGSLYKEVSKLVPKKAKLIGIYYDDPKKTEAEKLRYAVGVVTKIDDDLDVPEETVGKLKHARYNFFTLPAINDAVITCFPYNTFLSIFIAIARVYPAIGKYIEENKVNAYPAIELCIDNTMFFYMPMQDQEQHFVPQAEKKHT